MDIQPEFQTRNFVDALNFPDVTFGVENYSWHVLGGPRQATITAWGNEYAIWELLNWLRAPVTLRDSEGSARWWGFLHAVDIQVGAIHVGVSLDSMFNRVAVVYGYLAPGSATVDTRANTGWSQDDDSMSAYGTHELKYALSEASTQSAEQTRDTLLEILRYPNPTLMPSYGQSDLRATLTLRGWWDTLDWQYYAQAAGLEEHQAKGIIVQVGTSTVERLAQKFELSSALPWDSYALHVRAKVLAGTCADNLQLSLYSDSGGAPGSLLCSAVVGDTIDENIKWVSAVPVTRVTLGPGTTYWLVVERTGGLDNTNYFGVGIDDTASYARGTLYAYAGGSWGEYDQDPGTGGVQPCALTFQVTGVWETTAQIVDVVDNVGQFVTDCEIENASGVYANPYRDGDGLGGTEITKLLMVGTTAGRRLLAEVTEKRVLRVYLEPARSESTVELYMDNAGVLCGKWNDTQPLGGDISPVGKWCQLRDWPSTINMNLLADPSIFFIEYAEYDVSNEAWINVTPRGAPTPWELAQLVQG
jgi:hypothetical protein